MKVKKRNAKNPFASLTSLTIFSIIFLLLAACAPHRFDLSPTDALTKIETSISSMIGEAEQLTAEEPSSNRIVIVQIDKSVAIEAIRDILFMENDPEIEEICLDLYCADGGHTIPALAICQVMRQCQKPIRVNCYDAISAGALILSSGTKGRRFISPGAAVFIHQTLHLGPGGQAVKANRVSEVLNELTCRLIAANTGQPLKKIFKTKTKEGVWFSPEEAIDYGLADDFITLSDDDF